MAVIVDSTVIDGPDIQVDESRRGTIQFTFDDGRVITRTVQAPDAIAWANLLINLPGIVELEQQQSDAADAALSEDSEITAVDQANIKQVALAYLRQAYTIGDPYRAYLKFDKFNTYRINQGWTIDQVVAGLTEVGLTDGEWIDMKARYIYLANTARVTAMQAYQGVLAGDTWGEEFRQ